MDSAFSASSAGGTAYSKSYHGLIHKIYQLKAVLKHYEEAGADPGGGGGWIGWLANPLFRVV